MKINILKIPFGYWYTDIPLTINEAGYIEQQEFDAEECWNLLNWSCWTEEKPENVFSHLSVCNSDIILYNVESDTYHVCLPFGWKEFTNYNQMLLFLNNRKYTLNDVRKGIEELEKNSISIIL